MQTQHDTSLLDEVVKSFANQVNAPAKMLDEASGRRTLDTEAQAAKARAQAQQSLIKAHGTRAMTMAIAACIPIVAIGIAGWLIGMAISNVVVEASDYSSQAEITDELNTANGTPLPRPKDHLAVSNEIITTNFSLFREAEVNIDGSYYTVTAGHHFENENDASFSHAWCYTRKYIDGLELDISLGSLSTGAAPTLLEVSERTMKMAQIDELDIERLYQSCPWMEGPAKQVNTRTRVSTTFSFHDEVTKETVDRLVHALNNGATTVELRSPGGDMEQAIRAFGALEEHQVTTIATGECASACSLMFIAGAKREVRPFGSIGVHQWASEDGAVADADAQLMSAQIVAIVNRAGVSPDFFIAASTTPYDKMRWLTTQELLDWRVVI